MSASDITAATTPPTYTLAQRIGLVLGLVLGGGIVVLSPWLPKPDGVTDAAVPLIGLTVLVSIWWVTEALPLGATALIPAGAFPLLGIMPAKAASEAYLSPIVLLLLGGFMLALAVERSGAHRRLALKVLLAVGTSPRRLVLGFGLSAGLLSMWISNTATSLMMMPIALAIADRARRNATEAEGHAFTTAILLGTGYGASVGGMGTPVGTPPNLFAMKALEDTFPDLEGWTFVGWAAQTAPLVLVLIPILWYSLTRFYPKVPAELHMGASHILREELTALGRWRQNEIRSLAIFGVAAVLWVTRPDIRLGTDFVIPGWASVLGIKGAHDGSVAMLAVVAACAIPSGMRDAERVFPWKDVGQVPWGLTFLFGGGIAMSRGFVATGLSDWLGDALAAIASDSLTAFVVLATGAATFGTELMSNTALANMLMPILAATAKKAAIDPGVVLWPTALACSAAFMMPAATGPNAIVFGTGRVRIIEMVRAGFIANWLAWGTIVLATILGYPVLRGG